MADISLTHTNIERIRQNPQEIVGSAIYSADGEQFAYVRSVKGGYIELDIPWGTDYWLSSAHIDRIEDGRVYLALSRGAIDDHRLREPGIEQEFAPDRATTGDHVTGDAEALRARERMERDMYDGDAESVGRDGH